MFKKILQKGREILVAGMVSLLLFTGCTVNMPQPQAPLHNVVGENEIMITGIISDSDFKTFYQATNDDTVDSYTIILNTNGGGGQACVGIMNRIEELQAKGIKVHTRVYSKAYSAGFFIWMMGDTRTMEPGSTLMVHTSRSQLLFDRRHAIMVDDPQRGILFKSLDEWVIAKSFEKLPNVDRMTLETMLMYDGMTFFNDETAKELGMW